MRYSYAKVLLVARAQDCFINDVVVIAPQLYSLRGDVFRDPREWIAGLKLTRDLNKKEYAWAAKLADQLYLIDNQDMDARQQPPLSEFLQARFRASRFVHCVLVPAQGVQYEIRLPRCVP